jgi:hypothetical protein
MMHQRISRRNWLRTMGAMGAGSVLLPRIARAEPSVQDPQVISAVDKGLDWLASTQSKLGHWSAGGLYPTAMTALAGTAMLCEGSTATQGKYSQNIRMAIDFLLGKSRENGLIGDPVSDNRYTYGHGFGMLFLSQLLGEEEDQERREELVDVLTRAARFSGEAQTPSGGWGYVSAKDGDNFDEGSTTITQVQGLRGCRNAGIPVPNDVIDRAVKYITDCMEPDGGVAYSSKNRGSSRPAISAAAIACLFNAGEYDSEFVPKLLAYCEKKLSNLQDRQFGHWHYAYYYYSQVMYRQGGDDWGKFRQRLYDKIVKEQSASGAWQGDIGEVYITSLNLTILQLEKAYLPIYQR